MSALRQMGLIPGKEIEFREPDRDCWATPWSFIDALKSTFGNIELDVCCLPDTAKAARYWTPQDDGLAQPWDARLWFCNPPYSEIAPWILKGFDELDHNPKSWAGLYLLPTGRNGQPWHHALKQRQAAGAGVVIELKGPGRIAFHPPPGVEPGSGATDDSMVALCWKPFAPMGAYR